MLRSRNNRTGRIVYLIYPGDRYATGENCYIGTITGSCLVVCLFDFMKRIGGMINFVVPGSEVTSDILHEDIFRVGILKMELLFGDMIKLGCNRHYIKAKIFGAGFNENPQSGKISSPENNIQFVKEYFELEKIPIEKSDLGGNYRRQVYFSPNSGTVYRKIMKNNDEYSEFITIEKEYINEEFRRKDMVGKIILFD